MSDKVRRLWEENEAAKPPSLRRRFEDVGDALFCADFEHFTASTGRGSPLSAPAAFHAAEANARARREAKEKASPRPATSTLRDLGLRLREPLPDHAATTLAKDAVARFGTDWRTEDEFERGWRSEATNAAADWNAALSSHTFGDFLWKLFLSITARSEGRRLAAGAEVAALERRVAALEQRGAVNLADADKGVWKEGAYQRGSCVTFGGSYWLAKQDTTSKPGTDSTWRLVAKRGADGKDRGRST